MELTTTNAGRGKMDDDDLVAELRSAGRTIESDKPVMGHGHGLVRVYAKDGEA